MSNVDIEVRGLRFRYDVTHPLLEGIAMDLYRGERLGLTGANGSGKTSLLQLILGLEVPAAGSIRLFGKVCRHEKEFHAFRGRVGLMFQDPDDQLFCPTVEEDVAFGPLASGVRASKARKMVREVLDFLDISHLAEREVHQLSGGEKRLVALAGLLIMQPDVLLLDEPTGGLDVAAQAMITARLVTLRQSMVIVSHDADFLDQVSTRSLVLKNGQLREHTHSKIFPVQEASAACPMESVPTKGC